MIYSASPRSTDDTVSTSRLPSRTVRFLLSAIFVAFMVVPAKADLVIEVDSGTVVAGQARTLNVFIRGEFSPQDINFFVFDLKITPLTPLTAADQGLSFVDPGFSNEPFGSSPNYVFAGNSFAVEDDFSITGVADEIYTNDTLIVTDETFDFENITVPIGQRLIAQFQIQSLVSAAPGVYEISVFDPFVDDLDSTAPSVRGVSGFLTVTPVPEPASLAVLSLLGVAMVWQRKRVRRLQLSV